MSPRGRDRGDGGRQSAEQRPKRIPVVDWRPLPGRKPSQEPERERPRRPHPDDRPVPLPAHVGAWLDRYLWEGDSPNGHTPTNDTPKGDKPGRMALLESAIEALRAGSPASRMWNTGYARWKRCFDGNARDLQRTSTIIQADSRILLHVGSGSSVTDGSILLHHTWGVPYIPGSALKGIVRSALTTGSLRQRFAPDDGVMAELLGQGPLTEDVSDTGKERAAFVDFLDAPWVPPDPWPRGWSPLALDVVTPHHNRYYTQSQNRPFATDFDEPIPTHRLSISPGTLFHVVIEADDSFPKEWLTFVTSTLLTALRSDGIGAWTTSGYGRLRLWSPEVPVQSSN